MDARLLKFVNLLAEIFNLSIQVDENTRVITLTSHGLELPNKIQDEPIKYIVNYLNDKTGKSFKATSQQTKKVIKARLKDYSKEDILKVIDTKTKEWLGTKFEKYLQPSTLFRASNFENYVNQTEQKNPLLTFFNEDWQ